jgi:broad specificity phosphatase PhoE
MQLNEHTVHLIRFKSKTKMLDRIDRALQVLVTEASNTKTGCIAAIAHSVYLRMMLGSISNLSFVAASRLQQSNCCINVMDFPRSNGSETSNLNISSSSRALLLSSNFLVVPESSNYSRGRVLRINEKRHLEILKNTIT